MSLKPIYELEKTTIVDENHTILVYQDNRLKKLNAKDIFYSKEDINNNIVKPKNDIIQALANLNVATPPDVTLNDLINYVDKIDLFEIGVRRIVHDGTDTSVNENPKFNGMGNPQSSHILERCYKIGSLLTVIPRIDSPNAETDLIYAAMSSKDYMVRNDFYGGNYASVNWKNGIYPWNSMEKVQDENENWFTKVPLYFIKEEFVTDTGIDISASYPIIPDRYMNNIIYKYTFVCKTRLPGYRPAEFFYDYKKYNMVEDENGEYVYMKDLDCYTIPLVYNGIKTRYSLDTEESDTYTKILTREHYFSCYEASTENLYNGLAKKIVSKPGYKITLDSLSNFRKYCKNAEESYYVTDIRSHTDFFHTLFSIEFATTDSQSIAKGYTGQSYSQYVHNTSHNTNTNKIQATHGFAVGSYITIFNGNTSNVRSIVASYRKVLTCKKIEDITYDAYEITFDGDPITVENRYLIYNSLCIPGSCDEIEFRSAYNSDKSDNNASFRWNWIENPYGNIYKFIDGINIYVEEDTSGTNTETGHLGYVELHIYVSENPYLYNDGLTNYNKLKYILPSITGGYVSQLGYDPIYPWCQLPSKITSINNGDSDIYYAPSIPTADEILIIRTSGNWTSGYNAGFYYYDIPDLMDIYASDFEGNRYSYNSIFFEKPGK